MYLNRDYSVHILTRVEDLASRVHLLKNRMAKQKVSVKLEHFWELSHIRRRGTSRKSYSTGMKFAKAIGPKITVLTVLTPFPVFTADAQAAEDAEPEYKTWITESRTKLLAAISDATKAAGCRVRNSARVSRSSL